MLTKGVSLESVSKMLYGHSHRNIGRFEIGKTVLLSNQLGYVNKLEQNGFDRACCFII